VIDDRVAKKCPNGFIICDVCGSCCSNEQFARRIDTLKTNGQSVPQSLIDMYSKREGHWEKTECYCYKCQKEMVEDKNGDFVCKECNIKYDRYNAYVRFLKEFENVRNIKRQKEIIKNK
jgi:hypothetical protein